MSWLKKINRGETTVDFVGKRKLWFRISAVMIGISILALILRGGLNLGIEFVGGVAISGPNPAAATIDNLRDTTDEVGIDNAVIQLIDDGNSFRVQTPSLDPDAENTLIAAIADVTGTSRAELSIDAVGPSFGALILRQSLVALGVFLVAVMLFMTWRMEWKMAASGIAALLHDLVITTGVYAVTGFEVTPATVIALLTILGYSLYDTVVVFDKVGEMVEDYGDRFNYSDLVNRSMNLVLARSLNTSLTSLLVVGSILFVGAFVLGATALQDFALALFVGLAASTYSSIFVAAPVLGAWKEREDEWTSRRRRLEAKAGGNIAVVSPGRARSAKAAPRPVAKAAPRPVAKAAPRPPKKRKR